MDPDHPATFSARIVDLVKNRPDFEGAVLTDDLEMGAVVKHYPMGQAAVAAIEAGHDLALVCRRRDYIDECRQALVAAVSGGRLSPERLADARRRTAKLLAEVELIRTDDQTLNEWFGRLAESDAEE